MALAITLTVTLARRVARILSLRIARRRTLVIAALQLLGRSGKDGLTEPDANGLPRLARRDLGRLAGLVGNTFDDQGALLVITWPLPS